MQVAFSRNGVDRRLCYNNYMRGMIQKTENREQRTERVLRSFSLIELMVTLAIMGLLTVTVLPSLGKVGRNGYIANSALLVNQTLAETRSAATSPDPTICPLRSGVSAYAHPVNSYALLTGTAAGELTPRVQNLATDQVDTTTGWVVGETWAAYDCGISANQMTLADNQMAILARYVDPNGNIWNEGVVRVVPLEGAAHFAPAYFFSNPPVRPTLVGYTSPGGALQYNGTQAGNFARYNYYERTSNGCADGIRIGSTSYGAIGPYSNYMLIGLQGDPADVYRSTVFIHLISGLVSSGATPPSEYTMVSC